MANPAVAVSTYAFIPSPAIGADPASRAPHPHVAVGSSAASSSNDANASFLGQATLLNWLGQRPISFHRIYVDITGSVVAGLWLSHALGRAANARPGEFEADDFVFSMSARDCEAATGITRAQQAGCRQRLVELGLLSVVGEQRKTPVFRLHMHRVADCMVKESQSLASAMARSAATRTA